MAGRNSRNHDSLAKCKVDCILRTVGLAILLKYAANAMALLLLKPRMNFLTVMQYWISNLNQSWADLWGIMSFIPAITIVASFLAFLWGLKVLMINSEHSSVREYVFKSLISCYAVACCWGVFFAFCAIFVSPIQIYNQQSETVRHFSKPSAARASKTDPENSYAKHSQSEAALRDKGD